MKLLICAPDIFAGDAVGNHCLGIARSTERLGMAHEIYAQRFDTGEHGVLPIDRLFQSVGRDDILLVSYSIFDPYLEKLLQLNCHKICYFHGVTPPELLQDFEPVTADLCRAAIQQLQQLSCFDLIITNSQNSAKYLATFTGIKPVRIVPPVFADMPIFQQALQTKQPTRKAPNLLVVGRVVPHKNIELAIELLAHLRKRIVMATLSIVGSMPNYDYSKFLINHARALGVLDYVDFNGMLDNADLFHCYESSDALIIMSRHEGFCIPVLEAMYFGKPVFVRSGTAAQELCFPEDIISADDNLDVWANTLIDRLNDESIFQAHADNKYALQAKLILQNTSDEAWHNLLNHFSLGEQHD